MFYIHNRYDLVWCIVRGLHFGFAANMCYSFEARRTGQIRDRVASRRVASWRGGDDQEVDIPRRNTDAMTDLQIPAIQPSSHPPRSGFLKRKALTRARARARASQPG